MQVKLTLLSALFACLLSAFPPAWAEEAAAEADTSDAVADSECPRAVLPPSLDSTQTAFLRERAESGDAAMQCLYGLALLSGSVGFTDREEGAEWLRKAAEAGDERGCFEYGKMLYQGTHGKKEQAASLRWLIPAAERGVAEAAYYVGATLLTSEGAEHDAAEGERWMRKAAEAGLSYAQADMGIAYYSGLGGMPKDYAEAHRWFTLSAKRGNGDSCNKLGVMYRNGLGVTADPERAILWFSMGANLGDSYAQYNLANSYMNGEWVGRDYVQAARWHRQAAARGNVDSQYLLGCLYADGLGVEKNLDLAAEFLVMADRGGHADAEGVLDRLSEMEENSAETSTPPARVDVAGLLREFVTEPLKSVDKGRVVLMTLGEEVEITSSPDGGTMYLTLPGSPGVIHCSVDPLAGHASFGPGMTIRGVGAGYSGLPGFIRFADVREVDSDEVRDNAKAENIAEEE